MRDRGLDLAIEAVGGVTELARRLGISQPSVSNWARVPAERVLLVEQITGVSRSALRPDLYQETEAVATSEVDEVELARAQEYALLARLLARAPDADLLAQLSGLHGDRTPLGAAHGALGAQAAEFDAERAEREYFALFIGVGCGELLPYASHYLTGFLYERPLARLREDLGKLGIEPAEGVSEPEDHIAILCEIMAGLIDGRLGAPQGSDRTMFEMHLAPWVGRFFADLEKANAADFYRHVGTIGRLFIEIEREAFALSE